MKESSHNILIRNLSELDNLILTDLKEHFSELTNTQTVLKCVRNYKQLLEKLEVVEKINITLQTENNELREKMDNLRKSLKDIQT